MDDVSVKRIDHLGLVAGVIKDLKIIEHIDVVLPFEGPISTGQAVAAMVINGLGFTDRPLSLTPEFFKELAVERLLGKGVTAEGLNRHRLGRALDAIHEYGVSKIFSEVASSVAIKEGVSKDTLVVDTSSFSVTGEKYSDTDEHVVKITHGYSKDHRPDLKQIVNELVVSVDGGIPLYIANHNGNASDSKIFKNRSEQLCEEIASSGGKLIGDSKLYSATNADNLSKIRFTTRIPETISEAKELIAKSISGSNWKPANSDYNYQEFSITHFGMEQTWVVYHSDDGLKRARKSVEKMVEKERIKIEKELFHHGVQVFFCEQDAVNASKKLEKKWRFHMLGEIKLIEQKKFNGKGRPRKDQAADSIYFKAEVSFHQLPDLVEKVVLQKACFIVGTNDKVLSPLSLLDEYKSQNNVELGFRFLKDPIFFTSSFFLKKTSRIESLIAIMSIALLVYSLAQRRLRQILAQDEDVLHDPIYGPTNRPTFRRVMQMFLGVNEVTIISNGIKKSVVTGVTKLRHKIIEMSSTSAMEIYSIKFDSG